MGSDAHGNCRSDRGYYFNPRSPDGERLGDGAAMAYRADISIHAPRMGSDHCVGRSAASMRNFNPRSPDGERLKTTPIYGISYIISIHAPRMGSDQIALEVAAIAVISIHAPRMGSDRENGHLRPRYGQNHLFSTLIVSQIVIDVLGTVRKSQKHQRTSHYEVIKQPERRK